MLARKPGYCRACVAGIQVGDEIAVLVGQWVHQACKGAEIARRSEAAGTVVLELVMPDNESITYVGTNQRRRKRRSPHKTLTRR